MTNSNRAQYKMAALRYCTSRDLDPMEMIGYPDPNGHMVARSKTRWNLIADDLEEFALKLNCLVEERIIEIK